MRTILQVPLTSTLKSSATQVAHDQGFSSVQEVVRLLLTQYSQGSLTIKAVENMYISKNNESRYEQMTKDFQEDKHTTSANSVDEILSQLS